MEKTLSVPYLNIGKTRLTFWFSNILYLSFGKLPIL